MNKKEDRSKTLFAVRQASGIEKKQKISTAVP
jgi:hypothetical protein